MKNKTTNATKEEIEEFNQSVKQYITTFCKEEDFENVYFLFINCYSSLITQLQISYLMQHYVVAQRIVRLINAEYTFRTNNLTIEEKNEKIKDKTFVDQVCGISCLKMLILRNSFEEKNTIDANVGAFSSTITALKSLNTVLFDFNEQFVCNDPNRSLIHDLFQKFFSKILGNCKMLSSSLASECFVSWRTIHEAECMIKLLCSNGQDITDTYVKHIIYNNALRGSLTDQEELDAIFAQMKEEMRQHDLKSKDMKKFIEYGWIYNTKEFDLNDPTYKLNFRDGVEKCADLSKYSSWYEAASEITHSSPVFFYSNEVFFLDISVIALYESSLRVTALYVEKYKHLLVKDAKTLDYLTIFIKECQEVLDYNANKFIEKYGSLENLF